MEASLTGNPFSVRDGDVVWRNTYLHPDVAERLLERLEADPALADRAEQLRVALHQAANIAHERDAA